MNKKLLGIGISLVIIGIALVATTVYQEQVAPLAVPHMEIPTAKYEWRSRNPTITGIGAGLIGSGVVLLLVGLPWKKKS